MEERVIYMKGGDVLRESEKLFPKAGDLPDGGPDKFLLSVLHFTDNKRLFLVGEAQVPGRRAVSGRQVAAYVLRPAGLGRVARRLKYFASSARFFFDALRFRPSKILCGFEGAFGLLALLVARLSGAQFVFLAHCALAIDSLSSATKKANSILCRHSDLVIVHGPFLHDQAAMLGARADKIVEWNNGLDESDRRFLASIESTHATASTILYFGRMEEDKGIFDLLEAFNALPQNANLKLQFIGGGSALERLRATAAGSAVRENIDVVGHVRFEDMFSYIVNASVVVTPTRSTFAEGLCQSVIESFYAGKPVIAPDFGPFPYIVKDGSNGLLFAHDSVASLTAALHKYFADENLRTRVHAGAAASGQEHMNPSLTFTQALGKVFQ
ncbi:glycosyltransferase family 4 protein [Xylophilus sp. GOD-11R]|uniref:glycosyltransferase family 4 protein n=1 Tax=Xylophilus sp. GOD-11R TaxID=3089814 RepID=UPI00298C9706|nr:glycosyltransferase family 4 protein [Xylophilus sp. GOD-11R]WPB56551.1 glycosyltransferase family 4 protein [Xylophilus sp. GOD-11R]